MMSKVKLNNMHSPCTQCYIHGHSYSPGNDICQRCEYNIAIELLKKVLKDNDYCTLCKNRKQLGGGYWDCEITGDDNGDCRQNGDFSIDWEAACDEYKVEYDK